MNDQDRNQQQNPGQAPRRDEPPQQDRGNPDKDRQQSDETNLPGKKPPQQPAEIQSSQQQKPQR